MVFGVALVTVLAVSLTGCLGGTSPPTGNNVSIISNGYSFAFDPTSLTVHVGQNVTWTNNAGVDHTVTSDTNLFNSGILTPGAKFEYQFTTIGTFTYHCTIHTYMTGTIVVIA